MLDLARNNTTGPTEHDVTEQSFLTLMTELGLNPPKQTLHTTNSLKHKSIFKGGKNVLKEK